MTAKIFSENERYEEGDKIMAANPSIANAGLNADSRRTVAEKDKSKLEILLERSEEVLRKALGDDEETIANSLRGL
jgi:hypothetical protein